MAGIHRRVADEVFERLHDRIVTGDLAPGDRVDPTQVAESLGVSRTPVREAILRLDALGLVERLPYRGVVVTAIDLAAAQEVTALRVELETLAARAAVPRLDAATLGEMCRLHDALVAAVAGPDAQHAFRALNREFHLTLYRAAGSPALERIVADLADRAERMRLHFDVRRGRALADHAAILEACVAGDVEAAVAATREHVVGTFRMMVPDDFEVTPGSVLDVVLRDAGADDR
ncbi:GntR family transcriptional regulator [Nocardioides alkalitolerans]|uniref:GntR family transcriptional regulator n=1 Tax=Nocardioides alkalitolerans TaxID=281714 RepID=UPI000693442C|nr:GntR family transcriptional regulator [Nocardioides alkalitolerans]